MTMLQETQAAFDNLASDYHRFIKTSPIKDRIWTKPDGTVPPYAGTESGGLADLFGTVRLWVIDQTMTNPTYWLIRWEKEFFAWAQTHPEKLEICKAYTTFLDAWKSQPEKSI
ncbi:hypothetical protein [Derxia lacustris]|uniref:hypothetical protein n=1 Tax=Derxia lacustris TaxID=764842 RepID=UPI00111C392B|nr:hypothetical protein [Derxia lacustris]